MDNTPPAPATASSMPANGQGDPSPADIDIFPVRAPPPLKCRRLEIPVCVARERAKKEKLALLSVVLKDLEKVLRSKKKVLEGGANGLQAHHARGIESCLVMMVKNGRKLMDASQRAAEGQGFGTQYGGWVLRVWVKLWVKKRELPASAHGRHVKSFTLLSDPVVQAELQLYIRSNKWAVNPANLVAFSQNRMVPMEAEKYLWDITEHETPAGLKRYMELKLFPRIGLKPGKGISLATAR
ncbi:hypothetical protein MD484_g5288, partial [Candolleomyces efflorescens]